jgi:hypothetical protein
MVLRRHHAEGFLNAQVKGAAHTLGSVPAEGAEATRHRALGLHLAFLDPLARLEGSDPRFFQLLL